MGLTVLPNYGFLAGAGAGFAGAGFVAAGAGAGAAGTAETGYTLTRRPDSNLTLPSTRLKRVKSRPVPTLLFSTQRAPRWRTMMPPARTVWPSPSLMPRRLDLESRPFLDEPPPFLCAIGRGIIGTDPVEVKCRPT